MTMNIELVQRILTELLTVIREYDWLINSNILDFYVNEHWTRLPDAWKQSFELIHPEDFGQIISNEKITKVWPLSILTLKVLSKKLCINREINKNFNLEETPSIYLKHPKLKHLFVKNVKPKKRHEIEYMAKVCYDTAIKTGAKYIIDFGSGLGHLARTLAYGYHMKVCCIEMQSDLNKQAEVIDHRIDLIFRKYIQADDKNNFYKPIHITFTINKSITGSEFIKIIKSALNLNEDFSFGMIGLHPCGDLATILMQLFLNCPDAKFINLIGCCYMKLTTTSNNNIELCGYPLSQYMKEKSPFCRHLTYESREIACHANEIYKTRLKNNNYEYLRVHSYRAALEKLIIMKNLLEKNRHRGLRSVKYHNNLVFTEYCKKALLNLDIEFNSEHIQTAGIESNLSNWKDLVKFYTMRLFFAPLIESVLLYDRVLYLIENDCNAIIYAIFDPELSPRNHVITSIKNIKKI